MREEAATSEEGLRRLVGIVRRLRAPGGCPWDRAQTHRSLRRFALEEAREVVQAIGEGSADGLAEELGDLLLQVLLHAAIAEEDGEFSLEDVMDGLAEKLLRRHPHVFGEAGPTRSPAEVERLWAEVKAAEAGGPPPATRPWLEAVGRDGTALTEARDLGDRAAAVGFDWPDAAAAWPKVAEEAAEFEAAWRAWEGGGEAGGPAAAALEEEFGDLLLVLVSVGRLLGMDAEVALAGANAKFRRRFAAVEAAVPGGPDALRAAGPERLEEAWQGAKAQEALPGTAE